MTSPHRLLRSALMAGMVAGAASALLPSPAPAAVPAQFTDTLVAAVPGGPTAIAFMPDRRMLVSTQSGRLWVLGAGALVPKVALDLSARTCTNSERGMLGVATDPDAGSNAFFVFYTAKGADPSCPVNVSAAAGAPVNRVSRFVLRADNTVDAAGETILLDGINSFGGNHNAGDLQVGKDGALYVSTGDGGCDYRGDSGCGGQNDAATDRNILNGKILRITRTGGVPADNPFTGAGTARCRMAPSASGTTCQETFATGLRNPFRFAFDPNAPGTSFRINDVGQNVWEEIDQGVKGADYGWNRREGHCARTGSAANCGPATPAGLTDPIHDYGRGDGCGSITGGAFVPAGTWPAAYNGAYLFGDYVCGRIFSLSANGVRASFATGLPAGGPVDLAFGPDAAGQALYYTTYANGGEVRRIAFAGTGNRTPVAALRASPASGAAPLATTLDGSASSDPDGDTLTYLWSFGDGSPDATTTTASVRHTYPAGRWTAQLRVRDARGLVSPARTVVIDSGNRAPSATIVSPAATVTFAVGKTYQLRGTATDPEDGPLPDSAMSWTVIRHHAAHTHPFLGPVTGNGIALVAPTPEDLAAAADSHLEIRLTVTDAQGLSSTVSRTFEPHKVPLTLATSPAGRAVTVNGTTVKGPTTVTSWEGLRLALSAPTQTDASARTYAFDTWSDAGAAAHTFTTGAAARTLTASFSLRGLVAAYHDAPGFAGTPVVRLDPRVGFDWGQGAPAPGIAPDTFSVRWTGRVSPRYSERYTFSTTTDERVRLWIDGKLLIDQWSDHPRAVHTAAIDLIAGVRHSVAMEYADTAGAAVAQLAWSSPSQRAEVIPTSRLFPSFAVNFQPAGRPVPAGYLADTGRVFRSGGGLRYGWNAETGSLARDRNDRRSPDQRYDTLIFTQRAPNPTARWELALPRGRYRVRIVAGDPTFVGIPLAFTAEGAVALRGTTTSARRWLDGAVDVSVTDGRLTVANGVGAGGNRLSFVEVALR